MNYLHIENALTFFYISHIEPPQSHALLAGVDTTDFWS